MLRLHSTSSLAILGLSLAMLSSEVIAQLGPASYRSLEDMVHNSEVVLLGRILAIDGEREKSGQATYKIRLDVEEVIKGGDHDHGYFYLFAKREQIETWISSRARLVLKSPFDTNRNSESAWVMVDFTVPSLMQLSLGEDGVLTQVNTEKDVLKVLRTAAQRLPGVVQMRTFQLPTELRLVKQANLLIQDGLPIVFVPIDRPLETWAKRVISGDTDLTLDSRVRALKHFKSEANIKWLRRAIATETSDSKRAALNALLDEWLYRPSNTNRRAGRTMPCTGVAVVSDLQNCDSPGLVDGEALCFFGTAASCLRPARSKLVAVTSHHSEIAERTSQMRCRDFSGQQVRFVAH